MPADTDHVFVLSSDNLTSDPTVCLVRLKGTVSHSWTSRPPSAGQRGASVRWWV